MKKSNLLLIFILLILVNFPVHASDEPDKRYLTLEDVIRVAARQSPDALVARHRYRGSYWQHRSHRAMYLPHLRFDATLPNLNRVISPVTQPDGTDIFVRRSLATSTANLSLQQNIGATGGQLFLRSGLQRMDLIREDGTTVSYLSNPVNIGFRQPIYAFNVHRWQRQIEPMLYQEARRQYLLDLENINIRAANVFFDLLIAQINININAMNLANADTLYRIAEGRYSLGRIAENELLQMELNLLNSEANLEQSKINYEAALFRFRSFLVLEAADQLELVPPDHFHEIKVDLYTALDQARHNRPDVIAWERELIDASSRVARARSESRLNADLFASFGLTQTAGNIPDAYRHPLDQQQVVIGLSIPILDWGVARGRLKMEQSNQELVQARVNQQQVDFEQEVMLRVMEFNMLGRQLEIAQKADLIAEKRYEVTRQRFMIGRVDIIELNMALQEKDLAKQRYLESLRTYWREYYGMRRLTLFDFVTNRPLSVSYDDI
jgi:outer membrane protein